MEETLTMQRLRIPAKLRANLALYQHDRIRLLDRGDGLPQGEALVWWRSVFALDRQCSAMG